MRVWDHSAARRRDRHPPDCRISITRPGKKRARTAAARRWQLLTDGMSIEAYEHVVAQAGEDVKLARLDISYGIKAHMIKLLPSSLS